MYDCVRNLESPLKDYMIDAFERTTAMQEHTSTHNSILAKNLSRRLELLEKDSWNREDAVEDMGNPA